MNIPSTSLRHRAVRVTAKSIRWCFRLFNRNRTSRLVIGYAWPDFSRKAEALAAVLREAGFHPVVCALSPTSLLDRMNVWSSRDLWIGFWNEFRTDYLPDNYYFFNSEPLHLPHWRNDAAWFRGMEGALEVWDYSLANQGFVTLLGVPWRHVPFGYSPYYEKMFQANTAIKALTEDIDVLFFGTLTDRRRMVLDRLEATGILVHRVTQDNPVRGAALDELLYRSRIVLTMYSYDDVATHTADFARLDHLLSNHRFVLHEALGPDNPDPEFEHHVATCPYDEIESKCAWFLRNPAERIAKAEVAYRWFSAERRFGANIPYDELNQRLTRMNRAS